MGCGVDTKDANTQPAMLFLQTPNKTKFEKKLKKLQKVVDKTSKWVYNKIIENKKTTQRGKNMKTRLSEEYYKNYEKHRLFSNKYVIDPEKILSGRMPDDLQMEEGKIKIVKACLAKLVSEDVRKELLKRKPLYIKLLSGNISFLGYTSLRQSMAEASERIEGFEYSCYLLKQFKTKYDIS